MTVPESSPVLYSSPIQTQAPADQSPSELMMKSSEGMDYEDAGVARQTCRVGEALVLMSINKYPGRRSR